MAEKYKCERKAHLKYQIKLLREKVEKIPETPNEIYGNPAFSDFRIQAGDETFYVTKYQLALKSKVFNRMFVSGMKEVDEGVVQIDDDPEAVGAMLKFLYLGKRVKGVEMAKNVVQLADRYEMTELKDQCELELLDNLTVAGSQDAFIFASQFQLSHLFLMATALLYYNFKGFGNDKLEGLATESTATRTRTSSKTSATSTSITKFIRAASCSLTLVSKCSRPGRRIDWSATPFLTPSCCPIPLGFTTRRRMSLVTRIFIKFRTPGSFIFEEILPTKLSKYQVFG